MFKNLLLLETFYNYYALAVLVFKVGPLQMSTCYPEILGNWPFPFEYMYKKKKYRIFFEFSKIANY